MSALPDHLPAYGGAWTGALIPGVMVGPVPSWFPAPLAAAPATVLLVLDGLGWDQVRAHPELLPTLSAMSGDAISTVAPTTTAAGLTSITTGCTPAEHGVVGYRMRVGGEVLGVLQWRTAAGQPGPDPRSVQPHEGFCGKPVPVVSRADFDGTGFTEAHLRTGRLQGWHTLAELVGRAGGAITGGEPFVYAYYDGVDKVAHEVGLRDDRFLDELRLADRLVADLLAALPSWCALAVTADHGHVEVGPQGMRHLDAVRPLVAAYSGEGRFRSLHARPGAMRRLHETAQAAYGEEAWVLTREQVWDGGLLGGTGTPAVRGRIGDVVLVARADIAYVAPDVPREAGMIGCHGSLTPAELEVPLLAARGHGPG